MIMVIFFSVLAKLSVKPYMNDSVFSNFNHSTYVTGFDVTDFPVLAPARTCNETEILQILRNKSVFLCDSLIGI